MKKFGAGTGEKGKKNMSWFRGILEGIFTYREPQKKELGFEFLEDDREGRQDNTAPQKNSVLQDDSDGRNQPLSVDEWNESRKNKTGASGNDNTGRVSESLDINLEIIKQKFSAPKNQDIQIREFRIGRKLKASLVFIKGMVDKNVINRDILPRLMSRDSLDDMGRENPVDFITENVLPINTITKEQKLEKLTSQVLNGTTALFIDGCNECLVIETKGFEKRNIEKPVTESVVKGPQEAFTENLRTNLTLVRRIIKSEKLVTEIITVGKKNSANCALLYIDGLVNPRLVGEVKYRLKNIETDLVIGDGMVEQLTEDSPLRLFGVVIAAMLPALYVGLVLYHQEMIPTELLDSIVSSKEKVPFPTIIEVIMLELSFELIREGGIRVPGVIGQTLGIIGALILGQAAVAAGLVSPVLIIIVAVTGLGSFTIPNYSLSLAIRIVRFLYILFAAVAGFYGISAALVLTSCLLCSMKSFGVPFLSPVAPKTVGSRDLIIRQPLWRQKKRPDYFNTPDEERQPEKARWWIKRDREGKGS